MIHLDYDRYHTPTEGIDFFSNLAQAFPDIADLQSIGTSIEGRDIWALKITDDPQTVEPEEERVLFCALHHAREWATHEMVLYLAEHLVTRYDTDLRIKHIVDNAVVADKVREFLSIALPRSSQSVEHYEGKEPLFHKYGIEAEIDKINTRHVPLKSGGSLVIDTAEALVAIDVNSGRFREIDDAEETAFHINMD